MPDTADLKPRQEQIKTLWADFKLYRGDQGIWPDLRRRRTKIDTSRTRGTLEPLPERHSGVSFGLPGTPTNPVVLTAVFTSARSRAQVRQAAHSRRAPSPLLFLETAALSG